MKNLQYSSPGVRQLTATAVLLIYSCVASGLTINLRKGTIATSRVVSSTQRLPQRGRLLAGSHDHLWVLSLPVERQRAVRDAILAKSQDTVKILHALPGENHAWLVHASADAIQYVLEEHGEDIEAAPLPPSMKLSPLVDQLILSYQHGDAVKSDHHLHDRFKFLQHTKGSDGETYVAIVASTTGVAASQAQDIATQVQTNLRQALNRGKSTSCMPYVVFKSRYLKAMVCPKDVEFVAAWLAGKPEVTWVELQVAQQTAELHSVSHIQSPRATNAPSYPAPDVTSSSLRPFWAAGLDGKGQVVGVVDTGLDLDSCYLYDPKQNDYQNGNHTSNPLDNLGNTNIYYNNATRKVAMYVAYTDAVDSRTSSHGTHVTTSIIGARYGYDPIKQPDYAAGVAPNAKVAFFDMDVTNPDGTSTWAWEGLITVDLPDVYSTLKMGGAYITSNSWLLGQVYDYTHSYCYDVDNSAWSDQETLHVICAGNDGDNQTRLAMGTITTPGTCKNALTVGATEVWWPDSLNHSAVPLVPALI